MEIVIKGRCTETTEARARLRFGQVGGGEAPGCTVALSRAVVDRMGVATLDDVDRLARGLAEAAWTHHCSYLSAGHAGRHRCRCGHMW